MQVHERICDVCQKPFELTNAQAVNQKRHVECRPAARRVAAKRWQQKLYERRSGQRAKSIAAKRLSREEQRLGALLLYPEVNRPDTRGECKGMPRPCPFVSCKHHLYLDVNPETGSIKINFPDKEVEELEETCALDVADKGGAILERCGELLNLTRERVRQIETRGLLRLKWQTDEEES